LYQDQACHRLSTVRTGRGSQRSFHHPARGTKHPTPKIIHAGLIQVTAYNTTLRRHTRTDVGCGNDLVFGQANLPSFLSSVLYIRHFRTSLVVSQSAVYDLTTGVLADSLSRVRSVHKRLKAFLEVHALLDSEPAPSEIMQLHKSSVMSMPKFEEYLASPDFAVHYGPLAHTYRLKPISIMARTGRERARSRRYTVSLTLDPVKRAWRLKMNRESRAKRMLDPAKHARIREVDRISKARRKTEKLAQAARGNTRLKFPGAAKQEVTQA
jgi:hypothetical protein